MSFLQGKDVPSAAVVVVFPKIKPEDGEKVDVNTQRGRMGLADWLRLHEREQLHELEIMIRSKFSGSVGFTDFILDEGLQYWIPIIVMKFTKEISLESLMKFVEGYSKIRGYKLEIEAVSPELGATEIWEYVKARDSLMAVSV